MGQTRIYNGMLIFFFGKAPDGQRNCLVATKTSSGPVSLMLPSSEMADVIHSMGSYTCLISVFRLYGSEKKSHSSQELLFYVKMNQRSKFRSEID